MQGFRPRPADFALPAVVALAGAAEILAAGYERAAIGLAAYVLAASTLVFARALPLALPPLVAGVYAATPLLGFDVSQPASWIPLLASAFFAAGLYAPPSRWLAGIASVAAGLAISYATLEWLTDFEPNLLFGLAMTAGPWALGLGLRTALERERRAGADAERARVEVGLARERAVASERERIAVELHDVLAHALGAMVLQASAAADLVRRDGSGAARILDGVAQAGREALAETGRLLRLLRDERDELGLGAQPSTAPGDAQGRARETRRLRRTDLALPVVFAVVATAELVIHDYGPLWAALGAYWLAAGLLVARRAAPLAMPLTVTAILVGVRALGVEADEPVSSILIGGLAFFAAGRHASRPRLGLAAFLPAFALLTLDMAARGGLSADVVLLGASVVAPWAVGAALRATLRRASALAAEAERARLEGEAEAERAAAAERRRIARELHDLLASSLSIMVVQATLAADLVGADPDRAADAVAAVERSGRAALGETGRLLRLIHEGGDAGGTHPQPGVSDLPALAAEYERAGLAVELDAGSLERVPAGVDVSVYRIVQEALTNALKHAPGSRVHVRLSRNPSEVEIEVVNDRPRGVRRTGVASGHGLTGLRERVAVYGGRLEAGPTADGGFHLEATMAVTDAA